MGRVVLITGGTRGIGAAIAAAHRAAGFRVFVTSRRGAGSGPDGIEVLPLDVTDAGSVRACVAEAVARAGAIDVLVNNAGYDLYGAFEETSPGEFAAQMATNFGGAVEMCRAVLPGMREAGRGRIVQIGSLGGVTGLPMNSAYAASKFALHGFSQSLAREVRPFGIWVSVVVPGVVATGTLDSSIIEVTATEGAHVARRRRIVTQLRRDGAASRVTSDDVARAVLRASTDARPRPSYLVGGQARFVSLAQALLPGRAMEAMMARLFA